MTTLSLNSYSQLIDLNQGETIKASDLNLNFQNLNTRLENEENKDVTCSWRGYTGSDTLANIRGNCINSTGHSTNPSGNGSHTLNFVSGFWSGTPNCVCSVIAGSPGQRACNKTATKDNIEIYTANSSGYNYTYMMICHGYTN